MGLLSYVVTWTLGSITCVQPVGPLDLSSKSTEATWKGYPRSSLREVSCCRANRESCHYADSCTLASVVHASAGPFRAYLVQENDSRLLFSCLDCSSSESTSIYSSGSVHLSIYLFRSSFLHIRTILRNVTPPDSDVLSLGQVTHVGRQKEFPVTRQRPQARLGRRSCMCGNVRLSRF